MAKKLSREENEKALQDWRARVARKAQTIPPIEEPQNRIVSEMRIRIRRALKAGLTIGAILSEFQDLCILESERSQRALGEAIRVYRRELLKGIP